MFKKSITYDDKGIDGTNGIHGVDAEGDPYYGPPQAGQDFASYESFMSAKNIALGGGIVLLTVINPLIGAGAVAAWLFSGRSSGAHTNKPTSQGG